MATTQTLYPAITYLDAKRAIAFLETAFGMTAHTVYADGDTIEHAEMRIGDSLVMLGSKRPTEGNPRPSYSPHELGTSTVGFYVAVDDPDALFARASAAGARIVGPLADTEYESREFAVADTEDYRWSFGTYAPVPQKLSPSVRFEDARAGVEFLETALGFTRTLVVPAGESGVAHAEMSLGDQAVMFGTVREDGYGVTSPRRTGGKKTGGVYAYTPDPDALFERATKAGAVVLRGMTDTPYGSREFTVTNAEGHYWSFGTYRP